MMMFSSLHVAIVLAAVRATLVCAEGTYKMPWSTDDIHEGGVTDYIHGEGRIGPDGPWQALEVYVGRSLGVSSLSL